MRVLVVDDERSIRISLAMGIRKLGVEVDEASDGLEGLNTFKSKTYDMVILDIKMPHMDGIEVLKHIRQVNKACIVIMMTHLSEVRLAVEAMKAGASEYFTKPFSLEEITEIVNESISLYKDKLKVEQNEKSNEERILIGQSKTVESIYSTVKKLSKLKAKTSVLLHGESGTGKEVVAQLISNTCAKGEPFVAINCAAIPTHLQESELFGHEQGAFSDAKEKRVGLLEHAEEGVMFLDEIGEMSLDMQAKLLRVLQERKFRRIGGNQLISFNAYVVAASNKNLKLEVERGNFRSDLYYRLNVIPLTIAPLRERKEDMEILIDHFICHYNNIFDKTVQGLSQELIKSFMEYDWPGNVRELKNIIERLMILSEENILTSVELPYELTSNDKSDNGFSELERAEQDAVLRALSAYNWNITKAASSLSISRLTLRRKIDKYGLNK